MSLRGEDSIKNRRRLVLLSWALVVMYCFGLAISISGARRSPLPSAIYFLLVAALAGGLVFQGCVLMATRLAGPPPRRWWAFRLLALAAGVPVFYWSLGWLPQEARRSYATRQQAIVERLQESPDPCAVWAQARQEEFARSGLEADLFFRANHFITVSYGDWQMEKVLLIFDSAEPKLKLTASGTPEHQQMIERVASMTQCAPGVRRLAPPAKHNSG